MISGEDTSSLLNKDARQLNVRRRVSWIDFKNLFEVWNSCGKAAPVEIDLREIEVRLHELRIDAQGLVISIDCAGRERVAIAHST